MSNVQYITNEQGQKTGVVLSMKQYQKLLDELEELAEVKAYDEAKRRGGKARNFREVLKEIEESQS